MLVIIGCHGGTGGDLRASDGRKVSLRDLQELVNGENAVAFRNCPKIFLISACRGEQGLDELAFSRDSLEENQMQKAIVSNAATDYYTAFSTIEGFESYRHIEEGTIFLRTVCEIWSKHFYDMNMCNLMTQVTYCTVVS